MKTRIKIVEHFNGTRYIPQKLIEGRTCMWITLSPLWEHFTEPVWSKDGECNTTLVRGGNGDFIATSSPLEEMVIFEDKESCKQYLDEKHAQVLRENKKGESSYNNGVAYEYYP